MSEEVAFPVVGPLPPEPAEPEPAPVPKPDQREQAHREEGLKQQKREAERQEKRMRSFDELPDPAEEDIRTRKEKPELERAGQAADDSVVESDSTDPPREPRPERERNE